ncbi:C4-dicarboxylate transport protein [Commensalibacter sp. Nvir]|uniref:C4-dicarboxylate transporter DctA n=1 Tax=Commensalibacter sp. Nvir TaxID=3069817 RepID=UPI002D456B05|nr:C4-dicarboxylate transport protein [Commensalibacter sp. Nvir]
MNKKPFYRVLYIQVIFAILLGIALGYFFPNIGLSCKPLGDGFIKIVKMIIAPVIFLTVVIGIAGMSDMKKVGSVVVKSMVYFFVFSTFALIIGLLIGNIVRPGEGLILHSTNMQLNDVAIYVKQAQQSSIVDFFMNIIPDTALSPMVNGNILQILFISIIFGISVSSIGEKGKPLLEFLQNLAIPVFKMIDILMRLAPIGAFGAMAFTINRYGIGSMENLIVLIVTFYLTSLFFTVGILGIVAKYNGFSIFKLMNYIKSEILLVLGTSFSEAALPLLMEKMERAGCQKSVVGLVIPIGYSFNLSGTNIYMTLCALFVAQISQVHLSLSQQLTLLFVAVLSSKGAAGVTGAGFVTLAATLSVIPTIPIGGMAFILGIDRIMSECRSVTNVIGNACASLVVARWEKALDVQEMNKAFKVIS